MAFGCSRRALILPLAVTLTVGTAAAQNENFLDRMSIGPHRQHQDVPQQATPFANPRYANRHEGQRRMSTPSSSGGGARVWANELGLRDAARLLEATLSEEKQTDADLTTIAESEVNQHAEAA
jgi:hypothetical protein